MRMEKNFLRGWIGAAAVLLAAAPGLADNECGNPYYWIGLASTDVAHCADTTPANGVCDNNCFGLSGFRCYDAVSGGASFQLSPAGCDPKIESCTVQLRVRLEFPGLEDMIVEDLLGGSPTPFIHWSTCDNQGTCSEVRVCGLAAAGGRINRDLIDTYVQRPGINCANAASQTGTFSVQAEVCSTGCRRVTNVNGLTFGGPGLAAAIGCPVAPPADCSTSTSQCRDCLPAGGGCAVSVDGALSCEFPGHAAAVRYRAGGAGGDTFPGTPAWRAALGLYVSHAYAQRIVLDPDISQVWLVTEGGSFRKFSNPAAGSGLRLYDPAQTAPSDEYRQLSYDTVSGGWQLDDLSGRKDYFRADGLWEKTVFSRDPSHPVQATYAGSQLQTVSFPDGRQETFTYHSSGKLNSISEVGVGGSLTRTLSYTWNSNDELTGITRADGSQWELTYDPARNGGRLGYLTQLRLIGTDLTGRVEAAFEYDAASGRVVRAWRGDPSFGGPAAVDKQQFTYTNPVLPTRTVVTRTVSSTFNQITTYDQSRDTRSIKPRITSIQGSCPVCGLSPATSFTYAGPQPLLPSALTDARGTRTDYTYNAIGRVLTRTEAANVPALSRLTTYSYDLNFPALLARIEVPSTSGGTNRRRTDSTYDSTTGVLTASTRDGFEAGAPLPAGVKTTAYTYNSAGEVLTIDPPGFATADATSFTYNIAGRNGHVPDSRTDPLIGSTGFTVDGLNRRTSVTDVNGTQTVTSYDALSRVTEIRQKGAIPADDLATSYSYNGFGDLFCVKLPRGNGLEHLYDPAGRLVEIRRGTVAGVPTSTSCLDTAQPRERTAWQYDFAGNRTEESLERWNGAAWVSESKTTYEHTCHLDRITQGAGSAAASVMEYCYDANDNLERIWDPNHPRASNPNPTQLYAYDVLNRMLSVTQPWTGAGGGTSVTTYGYDVQDHLTAVADAEGNTTAYTFSDRDLLTRQVSPVSGDTAWSYNEHGGQVTETDAQPVTVTRTLDVLDRVTTVSYPDASLDTTYTYDTGPFAKGRLTGIARHGETIAYSYDRFGRTTQDGGLTYAYDKNGNRTAIGYPDSVTANYTHDHADREQSLSIQVGANPPLQIVNNATYKPFGPPATLPLGNGVTETRTYDSRYLPTGIQAGSFLNWSYTTDAVGNITAITDLLNASQSRTYVYQDVNYFLTQGNGPWGSRAWSYDRIGNRLSETRGSVIDTYTYLPSTTGGHNPKLQSVTPSAGAAGARTYTYDPAGNEILVADNQQQVSLIYNAAGRLSALSSLPSGSTSSMTYDGRSYLRRAQGDPTECSPGLTISTYSTEGTLRNRAHRSLFDPAGPNQESASIFSFAGRPVAVLKLFPSSSTLTFLSTDHLGTPVLATTDTGALVWRGGFEPFGADWSGAGAAGVFLRFPGQWTDEAWSSAQMPSGLYQNVHRWYEVGPGRYTTIDLFGRSGRGHAYSYAEARPIIKKDPLGLYVIETTVDFETSVSGGGLTIPGRADANFRCSCCGAGWCSTFRIAVPFKVFVPQGGREKCARKHELLHVSITEQWFIGIADQAILPAERRVFPSEQACKQESASAVNHLIQEFRDGQLRLNATQLLLEVADFFTCF